MRRALTEDERALLVHAGMFGSDGYPVQHLGRGWSWAFRGIAGPPVVFETKREAVASFEAFLEVLREAQRDEAQRRAIRERLECGWEVERLAAHMAGLGAGPLASCRRLVEEVSRG